MQVQISPFYLTTNTYTEKFLKIGEILGKMTSPFNETSNIRYDYCLLELILVEGEFPRFFSSRPSRNTKTSEQFSIHNLDKFYPPTSELISTSYLRRINYAIQFTQPTTTALHSTTPVSSPVST